MIKFTTWSLSVYILQFKQNTGQVPLGTIRTVHRQQVSHFHLMRNKNVHPVWSHWRQNVKPWIAVFKAKILTQPRLDNHLEYICTLNYLVKLFQDLSYPDCLVSAKPWRLYYCHCVFSVLVYQLWRHAFEECGICAQFIVSQLRSGFGVFCVLRIEISAIRVIR